MVQSASQRLTRNDWLSAALALCETAGIAGVKIAPLAADMGVTTGSFYWHFKNRQELLNALLDYWEREMTDGAIVAAPDFVGSPTDRILHLMEGVMLSNMARYDLPIWAWAQTDSNARRVFERVLVKRFEFSTWMFRAAGFSPKQSKIRGRMMTTYMMGESTLVRDKESKSKKAIKLKHALLTAPE